MCNSTGETGQKTCSMKRTLFTTSWDDGHPLDLRVAELLTRHGFQGTFYVPLSNREGLPVMSAGDLKNLNQSFEIAGHTLDHSYLDRVSLTEAERQIKEGKEQLQTVLGNQIDGFA